MNDNEKRAATENPSNVPEEKVMDMLCRGIKPKIPEGADWRWTLVAGILMVTGGAAGVLYGTIITIASVVFFGSGLLVAGVLHVISIFRKEDSRKTARAENLLLALMYGSMGGFILLDPVGATAGLTLMLCIFFLVITLMRFSLAWKRRDKRGEMISQFIGGVTTLTLLGVVIVYWPLSTLWVIGVMVSVELLMNGWILVFASLSLRKALHENDTENVEKEVEHA